MQIFKGEFRCPDWVSPGAGNLVKRILDPNPKTVSENQLIADLILRDLREHKEYACSNFTMQRITIPEIVKDEWFKQGYSLTKLVDEEEDWDNAVATDTEVFSNKQLLHSITENSVTSVSINSLDATTLNSDIYTNIRIRGLVAIHSYFSFWLYTNLGKFPLTLPCNLRLV